MLLLFSAELMICRSGETRRVQMEIVISFIAIINSVIVMVQPKNKSEAHDVWWVRDKTFFLRTFVSTGMSLRKIKPPSVLSVSWTFVRNFYHNHHRNSSVICRHCGLWPLTFDETLKEWSQTARGQYYINAELPQGRKNNPTYLNCFSL